MLAGLAAIAIPIIIHLLNRQQATIVDWGAMRFLHGLLTSRSRRILIEEIILMALRCLAVALLALALARPFLPSHTTIPWALVLPAFLVGVMLAGDRGGHVVGPQDAVDPAGHLGVPARAGHRRVAGRVLPPGQTLEPERRRAGRGHRHRRHRVDDRSRSTAGRTSTRAVDEARAVVEASSRPTPSALSWRGRCRGRSSPTPRPTARRSARPSTRQRPTGGTRCGSSSPWPPANASLAQGSNPAKKIVILTDGQGLGWDVRSEARWQFVEAGLKEFTIPPQVLLRTPAPADVPQERGGRRHPLFAPGHRHGPAGPRSTSRSSTAAPWACRRWPWTCWSTARASPTRIPARSASAPPRPSASITSSTSPASTSSPPGSSPMTRCPATTRPSGSSRSSTGCRCCWSTATRRSGRWTARRRSSRSP